MRTETMQLKLKMKTGLAKLLIVGLGLLLALTGVAQPVITYQPTNLVVISGGNIDFSVLATGVGPLTYQWRLNGTNLFTNTVIKALAGYGNNTGFTGDGGMATNATLSSPYGVAFDALGNVYIADSNNNRVRRVDTNGIIQTFAGNGSYLHSGDGGSATNAGIYVPKGIAVDLWGNIFIASAANYRVRKVDTNGIITTVAGNGSSASSGDGGAATNAGVNPYGVAVDSSGKLFISEPFNHRVRMVDTNGIITTVAGTNSSGFSGDGGAAIVAKLNQPYGVAVDASGNLFIADNFNYRIRRVATNGVISTVVGTGMYSSGGDGGAATNAALKSPVGLFVDNYGYLFIADNANGDVRIRQVDSDGKITTRLAYSLEVGSAIAVAVNDLGKMIFSDYGRSWIWETTLGRNPMLSLKNVTTNNTGDYQVVVSSPSGSVTSSVVTLSLVFVPSISTQPQNITVTNGDSAGFSVAASGTGPFGYQWYYKAIALAGETNATLNYPAVLASQAGNYTCLVTNAYGSVTSSNAVLTVIVLPTIVGQPTNQSVISGKSASFFAEVEGTGPLVYQWQLNGTNVYTNGIISTVAGNGNSSFSGDGGAATSAGVGSPYAVAVDGAGNMFIAESNNKRVRKVDTNGIISTFAGNGIAGFSGDGGAATNAQLSAPEGVVLDKAGNVYIADYSNNRIRRVDTNGIITTVAGNGSQGLSGDGGSATNAALYWPTSLTGDSAGNLFLADQGNSRIRKIDTNGIITTVAGSVAGYSGDGGAATNAKLFGPFGVAVTSDGNLFIADRGNARVRKVDSNGIISTVVRLMSPRGICVDAFGNIFVPDLGSPSQVFQLDAAGIVATIAGGGSGSLGDGGYATNAWLNAPEGVTLDNSGNLLIADTDHNRVRKVLTGRDPVLRLKNISPKNAGNYQVIVTSPYGSVTSSIASLTVFIPPSITTQPTNTAVTNGASVVLNVAASGDAPLNYQWFTSSGRNATARPSMLADMVFRVIVTSGGSGYSSVPQVKFVDSNGSGASAIALVSNGMVTAINVISSGTGYFPKAPTIEISGPVAVSSSMTGQTNNILAFPLVSYDNATNYFVVVTNNYGSVTSLTATLAVFIPPQSFMAQTFGSGLQLLLNGTPNYPYILQSATNLTPPISWKPVLTNLADGNGDWSFTLTNLSDGAGRFYRAVGQ